MSSGGGPDPLDPPLIYATGRSFSAEHVVGCEFRRGGKFGPRKVEVIAV
jgi:hypothetical protein